MAEVNPPQVMPTSPPQNSQSVGSIHDAFRFFVSDARKKLNQLQTVIQLLGQDGNQEHFRLALHYCHVLKGGCNVLDYIALGQLLHKIETILEGLRDQGRALSLREIEVLQKVFIFIDRTLEANNPVQASSPEDSQGGEDMAPATVDVVLLDQIHQILNLVFPAVLQGTTETKNFQEIESQGLSSPTRSSVTGLEPTDSHGGNTNELQQSLYLFLMAFRKRPDFLSTEASVRAFLPHFQQVMEKTHQQSFVRTASVMTSFYKALSLALQEMSQSSERSALKEESPTVPSFSLEIEEEPMGVSNFPTWISPFCQTLIKSCVEPCTRGEDMDTALYETLMEQLSRYCPPVTASQPQSDAGRWSQDYTEASDRPSWYPWTKGGIGGDVDGFPSLHDISQMLTKVATTLAHDQHKQVRLQYSGSNGPIPPSVFETIQTCLIQCVRNAVSHGIEAIPIRQAHQKPACGLIRVTYQMDPTGLAIFVEDDGQGMQSRKIAQQALSPSGVQHQTINFQEGSIHRWEEILFQDEFSTSDSPTTSSGRGYGLNLVKELCERYHGSIQVESWPGQGSRFTLFFPWTGMQ